MITQHAVMATVHDYTTYLALDVLGGTVSLDDNRAPHVQMSFTVKMPNVATLAMLDPRSARRLTVMLTRDRQGFGPRTRTMHLGITGRDIDREAGTVYVEAMTDEAVLMRTGNHTNAPDTIAFEHQDSLRAIINNAALAQAGLPFLNDTPTVDVGMPVLVSSTNLFENPSAEVDLTGAVGSNVTLVRQTGAPPHGSAMFRLNNPTSNDSYLTVGGNGGDLRNSMTPGTTYTVSGSLLLGGAVAGAAGGNARRIVAYTRRGGAGYVTTSSPQAPNAAGTTRVSVTFTVPEGATEAFVRFYYGHASSSGSVFWDALKLVEHVPGDRTIADYWDGSTTNTAEYAYTWDGTPGLSMSVRRALVERSAEALMVMPGEDYWDFASTLAQSAGLRLFCDAGGSWRLVPQDYISPGQSTLIYGDLLQLSQVSDLASDDSDWCDAAVVRYFWTDYQGNDRERFDSYTSAVTPVRTRRVELNQAYPGPGLAKYIVQRGQGRGDDIQVDAILDPLATPSQPFTLTMPDGSIQAGAIRQVTFDLDRDEMTLATRGLTATPSNSWLALPAGQSWNASPVGASWIGEAV